MNADVRQEEAVYPVPVGVSDTPTLESYPASVQPAITVESERCLTDDEVASLVEGRLTTEERVRVERHLDTCSECRLWVAEAVKVNAAASPTLPPQDTSDWSRTAAPAAPGQSITRGASVGPYVILERLGSGGMGVVYAAYDPAHDRKVALKLVRPKGKPERWVALREQLRQEALAMTHFSHPNIVSVLGIGEHGDQLYLAMELVEGTTARGWMRAQPRGWPEVVDVFAQAGRGLLAAHQAGWVHRDFKPDNVLVGDDGRVCVSDFGLAKLTDIPLPVRLGLGCHGDVQRCMTPTGAVPGVSVPGTLSYMAPEQLSNQRVGERSDQFSFCVALYEALYGVLPFPPLVAGLPASGELAINAAPAGADVPARLRNAVLGGLKLNPHDRYRTMAPLLEELDALRALRSA
jgi:eukaryotic-like serine/threonine-protein kinase